MELIEFLKMVMSLGLVEIIYKMFRKKIGM